MAGKESITSHTRMMKASTLPPMYPDSSPRLTPRMTDSATEASPIRSDTCMPNMIAENTSRPWSSVPSQNLGFPPASQDGGSEASSRFSVARSNGLCGATQ